MTTHPQESWRDRFEKDEDFKVLFYGADKELNYTKAKVLAFIQTELDAQLKEIEEWAKDAGHQFNMDEYLPMVKAWDGKNFDVAFDHGYQQAKFDFVHHLASSRENHPLRQ